MAEEILNAEAKSESKNFIHAFVEEDIAPGGQFAGMTVHTRFPPEPNGYLHIGHCKALCIDFGTAEKFGGMCNLRMDDTNPAKEDTEFVDAIQEDIHWLGFDWGDRFFYGSDYFEQTYEFAIELIKKGLAYVCDLSPEEFKANRGDIGVPAVSPYRDRPVEENLDLFRRMRAGEFPEGSRTLRAKIDLASGNFNMRDPVMYRIRYIDHHRQGTKWCIFPMYDFAHPIQDALEGITHSLCSLEYERGEENDYWNAMQFLNPGFSEPKKMFDRVHELNGHVMLVIWPDFGQKTEQFDVMKKKGFLLDIDTWPNDTSVGGSGGARPYDPTGKEARDLYWSYAKKLLDYGPDAWWMDSTEPDHHNIKDADFDLPTALGTFRRVRNLYPFYTTGGVYEHQRADDPEGKKRIFILTRCAYAGQQRFGTNTWSGDTVTSWDSLKDQIACANKITKGSVNER